MNRLLYAWLCQQAANRLAVWKDKGEPVYQRPCCLNAVKKYKATFILNHSIVFLTLGISSVTVALTTKEMNCTVNIPGFFHHGNCELLCQSASWTDVAVFFLGNYVAHAATVINRPGQGTAMTAFNVLLALLFPGAGVSRGLETILTKAVFAPTALQMAARAGALCMVVEHDTSTEAPTIPAGPTTQEPVTASAESVRRGDIEMQESPLRQVPEEGATGQEQATRELQPKQGTIYKIFIIRI